MDVALYIKSNIIDLVEELLTVIQERNATSKGDQACKHVAMQ